MSETLIAVGLVFGLAMHQCGREGSWEPFYIFWGPYIFWGQLIGLALLGAWLAHSSL